MFGRPPNRLNEIVAELRERIVDGTYSPGERMPVRVELEQEFGAGTGTMQRSFNQLAREGFIRSEGRNGTFVSARPPHLSRYGVVFPTAPDHGSWSQFHVAALNEAMKIGQGKGMELEIYFNIDIHGDSDDFARLISDLACDRLAGLAFPCPPFDVYHAKKLPFAKVPCVSLIEAGALSNFSGVRFKGESYQGLVLDALRAGGCCRVAMFGHGLPDQNWQELLQANGFETRPYWCHELCLCPVGAREGAVIARLLMQGTPAERPDAVLILDDNLVEPVTRGLGACDLRIPEEITVIAHGNFPWPTPASVPVTRIGYDMNEVLTKMIELLRQRANGKRDEIGEALVAAVTEEQLELRAHQKHLAQHGQRVEALTNA